MTNRTRLSIVLVVVVLGPVAWAIDPGDIPVDAPQDEVMASAEEIRQMQNWAERAFSGALATEVGPAIRVEVRRQDHSVLRFGESCIETPMKLGERKFVRGLGTHGNSEIVLHLPPGAREFRSWVGVDNNSDTGGTRGSVEFAVESAGVELARTPVLRGTNAPFELRVAIPQGATSLTFLHNLFGDTNAVHVRLSRDGGYQVTDLVHGDTVTEVLNYVQFHASDLLATWRRKVTAARDLSRAEAHSFIADYVAGLEGYTYLEGEARPD